MEKYLECTSEMLSEWIFFVEGNPNRDWMGQSIKAFIQIFTNALQIGNMELLTQFDRKIYQQLNSLVMGVANSPDLTNLYRWYCEKRNGILNDLCIPFYGRYIDDCLRLVYVHTPQEALTIMKSKVNINNCELTWSIGNVQPFLDMLLYIDNRGWLIHTLYQKLNSSIKESLFWVAGSCTSIIILSAWQCLSSSW